MNFDDEHRDWLTLSLIPGIGSAHFIRLLARFHSPGEVLRAPRTSIEDIVGRKLAERIASYKSAVDLDTQLRLMADYGVQLVTLEDPAYPPRLAEIYDPPLSLFVRGELREEDACCVAIVGTRRATSYGLRVAEQLGRELAARGITVVGGLAEGIDAAAHQGALDAGGRTLAVLGNGVDQVYPASHGELSHKIMAQGALVSQYPMGVRPLRGNFPYRNRIISGLTLGTLIVEAPRASGALITARHAMEQGREVFAVPGPITSRNSEGPHALLREGAKLVERVEDILVELELPASVRAVVAPSVQPASDGPEAPISPRPERRRPNLPPPPAPARPAPAPAPAPAAPARPGTSDLEQKVLNALSPEGSFVDEIAAACRISISEALSSLTMLELKGLVRQYSGKRFAPR